MSLTNVILVVLFHFSLYRGGFRVPAEIKESWKDDTLYCGVIWAYFVSWLSVFNRDNLILIIVVGLELFVIVVVKVENIDFYSALAESVFRLSVIHSFILSTQVNTGQCGSHIQRIYKLFKMPIAQQPLELDIIFLAWWKADYM